MASPRTTKHQTAPLRITVRLPRELAAGLSAYEARVAKVNVGAPSRNDVLISLIERGLREATRR